MQTRCKFSLTTDMQEQQIRILRLQVHLALNPIYSNDWMCIMGQFKKQCNMAKSLLVQYFPPLKQGSS